MYMYCHTIKVIRTTWLHSRGRRSEFRIRLHLYNIHRPCGFLSSYSSTYGTQYRLDYRYRVAWEYSCYIRRDGGGTFFSFHKYMYCHIEPVSSRWLLWYYILSLSLYINHVRTSCVYALCQQTVSCQHTKTASALFKALTPSWPRTFSAPDWRC